MNTFTLCLIAAGINRIVGNTYKLIELQNGRTWKEAREQCNQIGMELVSTKTQVEMEAVTSQFSSFPLRCVWSGMIWDNRAEQHVWLDNDLVTWKRWSNGEPDCMAVAIGDCVHGEETCVLLSNTFYYQTAACDTLCGALCQTDIPTSEVSAFSTPTITGTPTLDSTSDMPLVISTTPNVDSITGTTSGMTSTVITVTPTDDYNTIGTVSSTPLMAAAPWVITTTRTEYHIPNDGGLDWVESRQLCQRNGMGMVIIKDEEIYNRVTTFIYSNNYVGRDYWIGMFWNETARTHMWINEEVVAWHIWGIEEPDCLSPLSGTTCTRSVPQNCVILNTNFKYKTTVCTDSVNVICQYVSGSFSSVTMTTTTAMEVMTKTDSALVQSTTQGPTLSKVVSYYVIDTSEGVNFDKAKKTCRNKGTEIAMIKNAAEYAGVTKSIADLGGLSRGYWIGMSWNAGTHTHQWVDDDVVAWTKWDVDEPDCMESSVCKLRQHCVRITGSFLYRTSVCSYNYYIVCQNVSYVVMDSGTNPTSVQDITSISPTIDSNIYPTSMQGIASMSSTVSSNIYPTAVQDMTSMSSTVGNNIQPTSVKDTGMSSSVDASQYWKITSSLNNSTPALTNGNSTTENEFILSGFRPKKLNCKCLCRYINTKWHFLDGLNITQTAVNNIVQKDFEENVEGNITVDKQSLSTIIQKKISVKTGRPVSTSIGWTAMLFLAVPCVLIVSVDLMDMMRYLQRRNDITFNGGQAYICH